MAPTTRRRSSSTALVATTTTITAAEKPTARNNRAAFNDVSNTKNPGLPPRASRTKKPAGVAAAAGLAVVNKTKKNGGKPPAPPASRRSARFQPPQGDAATTTTTTTIDASNKNNNAASTTVAAAAAAAAAAADDGKEQQALSKDVVPNKTKNDRRKTVAAAAAATKQSKEKEAIATEPAAKPAPRGRKKASSKPAAAQRKKSETAHNNNKNNKRSRLAPAEENSSSREEEEEEPRPTKVRRKTRLQRNATSPLRHRKPAVQHSHNLNVPSPFDSEAYTADVADHDAVNIGDVMEAPEYVTDIYQRLFHTEMNYVPEPYTNERRGISHAMRYSMVNRLVDVHRKCLLDFETLHLCISIVDRYCAIKNNTRGGQQKVTKRNFHLVGLVALLIASKYEEIYAFPISHCIKLCDEQYNTQDVLDMENDILRTLDYRISGPTAFPFLHRFLHLTNATSKMSYAASYYLERAFHVEAYLDFRPSLLAAAAVCLAINNPDIRRLDRRQCKRVGIPPLLLEYTEFEAADIYRAAKMIEQEMVDEIIKVDENGYTLNAAKKKFSNARFQRISRVTRPPSVDDIIIE